MPPERGQSVIVHVRYFLAQYRHVTLGATVSDGQDTLLQMFMTRSSLHNVRSETN